MSKVLAWCIVLAVLFPLSLKAQENTEKPDSLVYWEQKGLQDAKSAMAWKTIAAGGGGCLFGTVGGLLSPPTALTGGLGGSLGCVGGWGLGSLTQQESSPPISKSLACQEAYLRGYKKGKAKSNTVALLVGTGTTVIAIIGTALFWAATY